MDDIRIGLEMPMASDLAGLESNLRRISEDGFDSAEIGLDGIPLIVSGELKHQWIDVLRPYLEASPLSFSAHIGRGIDLRDSAHYELQERVLRASIEACGLLGLDPLVLHYDNRSDDEEVERRFRDGHVRAADYAAELGITLCMENIEVERVAPVVEFVKSVAHPNLKMTFDTGHAWLASDYFGFDFLEAVDSVTPHLHHLHLSDNTRIFEELRITNRPVYDALPKGYRTTFGRGDIHLPPYWGTIPFDEVFAAVGEFPGIYLCEYNMDRFAPFNKSIQETVRAAIRKARRRAGTES